MSDDDIQRTDWQGRPVEPRRAVFPGTPIPATWQRVLGVVVIVIAALFALYLAVMALFVVVFVSGYGSNK